MTYYWNALNQLVEVKEGTTTIATCEYDGFGRRTEKIAAGLTHTYIYDAEDIVEERISGTSSDTIRYHHGVGIDEPLARTNGSSVTTYYVADHLGSIVQESSAAGAVTLEREYDAWGALSQGASTSGFGFTGREWDSEIGLYYYRARYYSPAHSRFISSDPLGLQAGPNSYAYVEGNPASRVDPTGEDWWSATKTFGEVNRTGFIGGFHAREDSSAIVKLAVSERESLALRRCLRRRQTRLARCAQQNCAPWMPFTWPPPTSLALT